MGGMTQRRTATVYIAVWREEGIVKAGRTWLPSRLRKFEIRGAQIVRIYENADYATETALLRRLSEVGTRAFHNWQASVQYLGAGGTGFTECYRLDNAALDTFLEEVTHGLVQS